MAVQIDALDWKILRAMQNDPGASINAIADQVGLSHTPCWRRIRRMEDDGVITGRSVEFDAAKLGLGVVVFAQLRIERHDEDTLEAFAAAVSELPQVVECFLMSGDSDYLLRILVGSIEEYERFLKKVLAHLPGVDSIKTSFAMKKVKLTGRLPI